MTFTHRHLPHWDPPGQHLFITWRLYGSMPTHLRLDVKGVESNGETFVRYDSILDAARSGPLWLSDPHIAELILSVLQRANQRKTFRLHSYVVMANRVHVLIEPAAPLSVITRQVKGATAREANIVLHRTGSRFWQDESFDHWVRNPAEWRKIRHYIEQNPVKAGLVGRPEDWPWSSASRPVD
jgi:REP element-mobilizing transposase RayT